ncbi:MAG TPA: HDOD domain-containing protein [Candidatus Sulfotelmatobacter sp.]|nr:HDOD domain-containing protein [Candidatus Sulfotelmatobacter sp.]
MTAHAQLRPVEKTIPCIARQPILTADENVIGYELFLRESQFQNRTTTDAEQEAAATIDMLNLVGLGVLCDGRLAFINCTHNMLLSDYLALLPPSEVVVELQNDIPANEKVLQKCQALKNMKYSIALDNFIPNDPREALIPYARFLKIDITRVSAEQSALLARLHATEECRLLAQQVETREQFLIAKKSGFTRFEGYFFRVPENLRTRQIPANQATYVRLLSAVSKPEIDFPEIEDLIKHEPSLCYRLLRYLNSPLLGLSVPVVSVRGALSLLGEDESVRWIRMATTLVMGQERSSDLVLASLVRARFCELIAPRVEHGNSDLFLMGMLSLIDSILSVPIGMVIDELCLDPNLKAQLLGAKTNKKTPLSLIYDLMIAREAGDWGKVSNLGKQLNLSLAFIAETSNAAMRWAHQVTGGARGDRPH